MLTNFANTTSIKQKCVASVNVVGVQDSCVVKNGNVFTDQQLRQRGVNETLTLLKRHPQHLVLRRVHDPMLVAIVVLVPPRRMVAVLLLVVRVLLTNQTQCNPAPHVPADHDQRPPTHQRARVVGVQQLLTSKSKTTKLVT